MKNPIHLFIVLLGLMSTTYGQTMALKDLREMTVKTIEDVFSSSDSLDQKHYLLASVKNQEDSLLFQLEQSDLDSSRYCITTEAALKDSKAAPFPVKIHYVLIAQKSDTVHIEVEEYEIEFVDYFIFQRPIRYWACKGGFPQFADGEFVWDQNSQSWKFFSGRKKLENCMEEWNRSLNNS